MNKRVIITVAALIIVILVGLYANKTFSSTHAVISVSPLVEEASSYKGMFVLHGGEFSVDDVFVETSFPAGFAKLDVKGAYSSPVLFDGQRSVGIGHKYELIIPRSIKYVSFVALSPGGDVYITELPFGSHAAPVEDRVFTDDIEINGVKYFEVSTEAVGFVNDHHNQFSEFK